MLTLISISINKCIIGIKYNTRYRYVYRWCVEKYDRVYML